ncbi:MAG: hypothetical protein H0X39_16430, partial [Actinobacteria bacterium]|nr:hypothetical protein [Actinomycetota bacterium]
LAGIAAGLALGMKTNGSVLAAAVAVPVLAQLALSVRRGRLPKRFAGAASGALLGAILVTGGWWYARNWIQVGNPVAPFEVRALGVELFKGQASLHDYLTVSPGGPRNPVSEVLRSWWSDVTFWARSDLSYEERSGGLGPLWSWLGWPSLGLASLFALRRRPDLVVSVLLPAAAAFAVLPYRWWSRFTMYLAGLGVIAVVAMLERVPDDWRRRTFATAIVVLSLAGAALATRRVDPAGYGRRLGTGDLISLAAHPGRQRTVGNLFFHEFAWVDDVSPRATIGVEFQAPQIRFLYPLFGARLERHVVLLNPGDETSVDKRLSGREPAYLFVGSGSAFDRWARARPRRYRLLGQDRGTRVFRRIAR